MPEEDNYPNPSLGLGEEAINGIDKEPVNHFAGCSGVTSYNRVKGHFFLASLPQPQDETITRTVQGLADRFETTHEDPSVASIVSMNANVQITETVYQGEVLNVIDKSNMATLTQSLSPNHKQSAIVVQGGYGYNNNLAHASSTADSIIAIGLDDIRPFALKGLDVEHTALFDATNPTKPTNQEYVRHLTPEKESRVASIEIPLALRQQGLPPRVLVHYSAIDLTGEVVAAWKGDTRAGITILNQTYNYKNALANLDNTHNDLKGIDGMDKKGWLVVEKTVPDSNMVYPDTSLPNAAPTFRTLANWLKEPFTAAQKASGAQTAWDSLTVTAPGGIVSVPAGGANRSLQDHSMRVNPTGGETHSPFINLENCAHTLVQNGALSPSPGISKSIDNGYGIPVAQHGTRSPMSKSEGVYHTFSVLAGGGADKTNATSIQALGITSSAATFEQYEIIDNKTENDRQLLLVQPKNKSRTGVLGDIGLTNDIEKHTCKIELVSMRGRVEEIAPNSDSEGGGGVVIRGRSQMMDVSDRVAERDFSLAEGFALKEIGDLGSPTVSLTMGGLGQGGIDIAPTRTEHSFLPVWKDKVIGSNNPSVRNDRQTSTYYASTRALVELPLFPSMFYDVEQRLADSESKRSPLPSTKSTELIIDATMTAKNRPQMKDYENRNAIDWGMKNVVSSLKVNDADLVSGKTWIRAMRESSATFTRPDDNADDKACILGGSGGNSAFLYSGSYISVDSVLPFILNEEGGFTGTSINNASSTYNTATQGQAFSNMGFVVTIGEGIISERGIRFHIHRAQLINGEHRLYFDAFHHFDDDGLTYTELKNIITTGLPVTMGCWLTDAPNAYAGTGTAGNNATFAVLNATASTDNATMAQNFIEPLEKTFALGRTTTNGVTVRSGIQIDPSDPTGATILIHDGPTMEGFTFDPGNYLYGAGSMPLVPPVECRSGHLSLKGKRNDNTLDWVRPMRLNLGDIGGAGSVSKFEEAVDELIRRINQAGHPKAKNSNGGSAFNPPSLFTTDAGIYTVTSTDTGSHMGYVRAFLGQQVESRTGEKGLSVVIHCTVPGATGRDFAVWINNNTPYPYRPIQAVGHGGLVASNSLSYQASSFAAPLPLGMDGETHVPITTFQGGVHGAVTDADGNLRQYSGIGREFAFNTVALPQFEDGDLIPDYDPEAQPTLMVQRKALDIIYRINRKISRQNKGLILVDDKHLGEFDAVVSGPDNISNSKVSGVGSCMGLFNCQPLDKTLGKKWKELFYDSSGKLKEVPIKLLNPLIDANAILFFGGGHTGVTFDVSDGTDNDYSDFYTHHYAKGPTGYSGFQNLQEVQTSAAVLDFTKLKNADTVNENTYRGLHHSKSIVETGVVPAEGLLDKETDGCLWYVRMNEPALYADHGASGKELALDAIHGVKLKAFGDFANQALLAGPATGDPESKGIDFHGHSDAGLISLHKIETLTNPGGLPTVASLVPLKSNMFGAFGSYDAANDGAYSFSFFFNSGDATGGAWSGVHYGNGPVVHGIDSTTRGFGVSVNSKQGNSNSVMDFSITTFVHTDIGNGSVTYQITSDVQANQPKDAWYHVVVSRASGASQPLIYINGIAVNGTGASFINQVALSSAPHLPLGVGVGSALGGGYYGKANNMLTIGAGLLPWTPPTNYHHGKNDPASANAPVYFNGALSEIAMWNKALTPTEVATLYNARTVW